METHVLPAYWVRGDDVTVSPSGNPIFQLKFIYQSFFLVKEVDVLKVMNPTMKRTLILMRC